ncbi:hypothetical protein HPB47_001949 [Ixodes persulcatus]|uniref:Uncharacterized protein n=1 Tax=Ixodes persulcatus TaxID=34615 RepID=A0AC60PMK1_IXOPE|nr:hypothetical protein HPB47_001949 [Ixodes persulcatus]
MTMKCMGFGPKENKDKFFIYKVVSGVKGVMDLSTVLRLIFEYMIFVAIDLGWKRVLREIRNSLIVTSPVKMRDFRHELEKLDIMKDLASAGAYQMNPVCMLRLHSLAAKQKLLNAKELVVKGGRYASFARECKEQDESEIFMDATEAEEALETAAPEAPDDTPKRPDTGAGNDDGAEASHDGTSEFTKHRNENNDIREYPHAEKTAPKATSICTAVEDDQRQQFYPSTGQHEPMNETGPTRESQLNRPPVPDAPGEEEQSSTSWTTHGPKKARLAFKPWMPPTIAVRKTHSVPWLLMTLTIGAYLVSRSHKIGRLPTVASSKVKWVQRRELSAPCAGSHDATWTTPHQNANVVRCELSEKQRARDETQVYEVWVRTARPRLASFLGIGSPQQRVTFTPADDVPLSSAILQAQTHSNMCMTSLEKGATVTPSPLCSTF